MSLTRHLCRCSSKLNQVNRNMLRRLYSDEASSSGSSEASEPNANVPGLSEKVLKVPDGETGPGASKSANYKNPEYFSYHQTSYFDAELEMAKFRLPQPSSRAE